MVESDLQRTEGPPYRRQSEPCLFCRDSPCSWLWTPRPADREGRTIRWCLPWEREGGMEWGLFISSLSLSSPAEFEFLVEASSGSHQTLDSSVLVGFAERKTHINIFTSAANCCVCVSVWVDSQVSVEVKGDVGYVWFVQSKNVFLERFSQHLPQGNRG